MIRKVREEDAVPICEIYNHYIEKTLVTFEEEALDASCILQRIKTVTAKYPWLVYENDEGTVLGTGLGYFKVFFFTIGVFGLSEG